MLRLHGPMGRLISSRGDIIGGNLKHNMDQWKAICISSREDTIESKLKYNIDQWEDVYLQGETLLEVI